MKLSYFDLLSPEPLYIPEIGGIISPKLRDVASLGLNIYYHYLTFLSTDPKSYLSLTENELIKAIPSDEENISVSSFEILITQPNLYNLAQSIFNFFIKEDVIFSPQNKCFLVCDNDKIMGRITEETYPVLCDIILQRCCVNIKYEDMSKAKNAKALEIMQKLEKGRKEYAAHSESDKDSDLGNIISAVANKSGSINILNIWDLTIYQLYDCLLRLSANSMNELGVISSAVWGTKDNGFDILSWRKNYKQE